MDLSNAQAMGGENKTCKKCSSRGTGCMKDRMIAEVRVPSRVAGRDRRSSCAPGTPIRSLLPLYP